MDGDETTTHPAITSRTRCLSTRCWTRSSLLYRWIITESGIDVPVVFDQVSTSLLWCGSHCVYINILSARGSDQSTLRTCIELDLLLFVHYCEILVTPLCVNGSELKIERWRLWRCWLTSFIPWPRTFAVTRWIANTFFKVTFSNQLHSTFLCCIVCIAFMFRCEMPRFRSRT